MTTDTVENRVGAFIDNGDGTVTDTRTGLMWMRCALGQTWDGTTCVGEAKGYTWEEAMALHHGFAGHDDWRLPSIDELKSIIDKPGVVPACDITVFPDVPCRDYRSCLPYFWSSSPYRSHRHDAVNAQWMTPYNVHPGAGTIEDAMRVRLVCGGQPLTTEKNGVATSPVQKIPTTTQVETHKDAPTNIVDSPIREEVSDNFVVRSVGTATDTNETISANLDIGVSFDSAISAEMKGGENAFIIYLNIANNQKKQIRVELPFSSYVTSQSEEIEQDVWLSGFVNGGQGATIRAGALKKTGLVFFQSKLKAISAGDQLHVTVLVPKSTQRFNYSFICRNPEQRSFSLIEAGMEGTAEPEGISSPQPAEQNNAIPNEHGATHEAANIVERLQLLEEKLSSSIARVERMGDVHVSGKQTVRAAIDFIKQRPELFAAEIAELRAFLGESTITPVEAVISSQSEPQALAQIVAWLATLEMVTISDLRTRLLPLDLLPGAVIDDLNERALDLTGDLALEEDGENFIIVREVLARVVSAW